MSAGNPVTSLYDLCEHCGHLYKVHYNSECSHHDKIDANKPLHVSYNDGSNAEKCDCPGFSKKMGIMISTFVVDSIPQTNPCKEIYLGDIAMPVEINVPQMPILEAPEGVQGVVDPETGVTPTLLPLGPPMTFEPKALSWEENNALMCICGHTKGKHTQIVWTTEGETGGVCCGTKSHKDQSDCPSACHKFTEVVFTKIGKLDIDNASYGFDIETDPKKAFKYQFQAKNYLAQAQGAADMAKMMDSTIIVAHQGPEKGTYKHLIMDDLVSQGVEPLPEESLKKWKKAMNFGLAYGAGMGKSTMVADLHYGMMDDEIMLYKPKPRIPEHTEGQLEDVGNWLYKAGKIQKTVIQGHDLRDICIAYAAEAMKEMTANFDANVEKAVNKRMEFEKKQHKAKCIPSYKKNGRKFRDDNG